MLPCPVYYRITILNYPSALHHEDIPEIFDRRLKRWFQQPEVKVQVIKICRSSNEE
jgi:hypothetical protein